MDTKQLLSEQVILDLEDFIKNPKGFVLLVGKNGRGKSYAAMKVYERLAPFKLPCYDHDIAWFINQADLNMLFSESIENYGSSMTLLKKAYYTKLLILDDLGTRTPTSAFMDFIYAIVDKRWNERDRKATIITTNLEASLMRKNFGDAIVSRIASGRKYIVIGDDRRLTDLGF